MTPFKKAHIPESEYAEIERQLVAQPPEFFKDVLGPNPSRGRISDYIRGYVRDLKLDQIWANDTYQVAVRTAEMEPETKWPPMWHLSIKRLDREPIHDWRELQEIKNRLVGPEHEGIELYPSEKRKVDSANQYHMFVLKDSKQWFPFGFVTRYVTDDAFFSKAKQRPFKDALDNATDQP